MIESESIQMWIGQICIRFGQFKMYQKVFGSGYHHAWKAKQKQKLHPRHGWKMWHEALRDFKAIGDLILSGLANGTYEIKT